MSAIEARNAMPRDGSYDRAAVRGDSFGPSGGIGVYGYANVGASGSASVVGNTFSAGGVGVDAIGNVGLRVQGHARFDPNAAANVPIVYRIGSSSFMSFAACPINSVAIAGGCVATGAITFAALADALSCVNATATNPGTRGGLPQYVGSVPAFTCYCCRSATTAIAEVVCLTVGVP